MGQITQRQATLALVSLIFVSLAVIVVSNWFRPDPTTAGQEVHYLVYLLIAAVIWLLAWFDWPYARHLTAFLLTVVTALTIPESLFVPVAPIGVLVPPILASVIIGIPGVVGSAAVTWLILLARGGAESAFASPQSISVYILAVGGLVLGRMVVDARLAQERELLQALMDNMPDFIYFKDKASRFSRINRTHAKMMGLDDPLEAIGKTDFDFQPTALSQSFYEEEQQMMATGEPILDRIEYNPTADDIPRWLSATKAPIRAKNGRITGMVGISRDISERMLMEAALKESERNYREIFNASSDAILIYDAYAIPLVDVNGRMLEMFGYTYEEAMQTTVADLSLNEPPYSRAEALIWLEKAINEGPQQFEWLARRKDSSLFWTEISVRCVQIGGHTRLLTMMRDISERKQSEEALRLSEEQFAKAFRATRDAISISTLADGRFIEINEGHSRIFGYSREEAIGQNAHALNLYADPADRQRLLAILQEKGEVHELEIVGRRKSGELFAGLFSAEIIHVQGEPCIVGTVRDISERKRVEEALRLSEELFSKAFRFSPDSYSISTLADGRFIEINDAFSRISGYSREEVIGQTSVALNMYVDPQGREQLVKNLQLNGEVRELETTIRRKSGELFDAQFSAVIVNVHGEACLLGIIRDVSERKQAEEALRLSEERFAKAFRASQDAIAISTVSDGRIIEINDAHTRIFGYSREEAIGQTTLSLQLYANPADRQRLLATLQEKGEVHDLEIEAQRKSGELFDCLFSAETIYLQNEFCLVATMRDVTAEKRAAAALQAYATELERSNRELESFAYIASHDLQEPLRKIQSFSHRLLERYGAQLDERGQDYLQRMDSASVRMQALIRDLLAYARISTHGGKFTAVSLATIAQEVLADLDTRLDASNGRVIIGHLPDIEADPTQMRQLLQNLIGNALKFHRPDVPPIVEVAGEMITSPDRQPVLWLTVADNGIGFDEAYLPRLFTMFQRLHGRDSYEGTGVGLAICRRIAERHGGSITARSTPGEGTTFIVTLPVKRPPG
jgi:PAS domain S-box-containing protein